MPDPQTPAPTQPTMMNRLKNYLLGQEQDKKTDKQSTYMNRNLSKYDQIIKDAESGK